MIRSRRCRSLTNCSLVADDRCRSSLGGARGGHGPCSPCDPAVPIPTSCGTTARPWHSATTTARRWPLWIGAHVDLARTAACASWRRARAGRSSTWPFPRTSSAPDSKGRRVAYASTLRECGGQQLAAPRVHGHVPGEVSKTLTLILRHNAALLGGGHGRQPFHPAGKRLLALIAGGSLPSVGTSPAMACPNVGDFLGGRHRQHLPD